jgi:hypothetical protein
MPWPPAPPKTYWTIPQLRCRVRRGDGSKPSTRALQYLYTSGLLPPSVVWTSGGRHMPLYAPGRVREIATRLGWQYVSAAAEVADAS